MNGCEFIIAPAFNVAFAVEVHNHGALFRLQGVVTTICYEAVYDVIKGVVIVVEQDNVPVVVQCDVG